jgi:hypothetical protein
MDKSVIKILRTAVKDGEVRIKAPYTGSIIDYILAGKDEESQLRRLSGVMAVANLVLAEDDGSLLIMLNFIAARKGINLLEAAQDLKDFRVAQRKG